MPSAPRSIIITGANRGIGLGLVKQLLLNPGIEIIIATTRSLQNSGKLKEIQDSRLKILELEVTNDQSIDKFVKEVDQIVGPEGLNCLVNNAGIMLSYTSHSKPSRSLLQEQLDVNTISVVLLTQKLLPLLRRAASQVQGPTLSTSRAAVLNISSFLGSIEANDIGSSNFEVLAYRMSKTAINQFTKTLSIDLKDEHILVVSFEPGWVQTDMGTTHAPLTVEESTSALAKSFVKLTEEHNGGFFHKELTTIPW